MSRSERAGMAAVGDPLPVPVGMAEPSRLLARGLR
jgi:hypothetical protein